jgi:hypothetical protein
MKWVAPVTGIQSAATPVVLISLAVIAVCLIALVFLLLRRR